VILEKGCSGGHNQQSSADRQDPGKLPSIANFKSHASRKPVFNELGWQKSCNDLFESSDSPGRTIWQNRVGVVAEEAHASVTLLGNYAV
jgi:hypothetical protein